MFAYQEAIKNHLFSKQSWLSNLVPGIVVGVVALPLAMAFAIASGVAPEKGLYTAIVAGFFVSLFGGSRVQIAGPTGAFVILLHSIVQQYGFDGLQLATFLAGIFLILMGVLKLGTMIKYIPEPVIIGFTSGIALTIFVGQLKDFFGLTVTTHGTSFVTKILDLYPAASTLNVPTTLLGLGSLILIVVTNRYLKPIPGFLVALVLATVIQSICKFHSVATIGSVFGGIPQALPSFHLPHASLPLILELIGPAFTIALLGAIESLLSASVADSMIGTHHYSNHELIGQGLANVFTPLFGGFAATGAIARTATNIKTGGNAPIAGLIHCVTLISFILVLAPCATAIPITALSAVLFVVSYNMSDYKRFYRVLSTAPYSDRFVLLTTFFLTIFVDLVVAVNVGVIFATLFFMRRMAHSIQIEHATSASLQVEHISNVPKNIGIYSIEGPFFFGAIGTFQSALSGVNPDVHTLIIRLKHVPFIDVSALDSLRAFITTSEAKTINVIFCEANELVEARMNKARLMDAGKDCRFGRTIEQALALSQNRTNM